jgi:hypothetical protein
MPNTAANQIFSGLRNTETEAMPKANTAIRFKNKSVYTRNCFKALIV